MSFELKPFSPSRFSNQGKALEKLIERTAHGRITLVRIPDAHSYGGGRLRRSVPCDFIGHVCGRPLMVEAKETAEDRILRSTLLRPKSVHQYEAMQSWVRGHPSNLAGYLCHTSGRYLTWVPVQKIESLVSVSPGRWDHSLQIRGIDLLKDPIDWVTLILGENGNTKS